MDHSQNEGGAKGTKVQKAYEDLLKGGKESVTSLLPGSISEQLRASGIKMDFEMPKTAGDYLESFMTSSVRRQTIVQEDLLRKYKYATQKLENDKITVPHAATIKKKYKKMAERTMLNTRRKKRFTRQELVQYGITRFSRNDIKFEDMIVLHKMWKGYASNLINPKSLTAYNCRLQGHRVARMEFVGCFFWVHASSCKSMIGTAGICVKETMHLVQLVTKQDRVISIPKASVQLRFELGGHVFTVFGVDILYRSVDRSVKKYHIQNKDMSIRTKTIIPKKQASESTEERSWKRPDMAIIEAQPSPKQEVTEEDSVKKEDTEEIEAKIEEMDTTEADVV